MRIDDKLQRKLTSYALVGLFSAAERTFRI